ncbi:hypothetical protein TI39_contig4120g00007 [Zymoseptoria brevis]|uniref:Uncharacterized protein n=1 Tax=Zymoseptoria brevis TaxID=1047168 RepID=A0A0F4GD75_9PEZI|nr:hypothetical protein TI39_contig4120g00007 [Zymoseptoria brevis]
MVAFNLQDDSTAADATANPPPRSVSTTRRAWTRTFIGRSVTPEYTGSPALTTLTTPSASILTRWTKTPSPDTMPRLVTKRTQYEGNSRKMDPKIEVSYEVITAKTGQKRRRSLSISDPPGGVKSIASPQKRSKEQAP